MNVNVKMDTLDNRKRKKDRQSRGGQEVGDIFNMYVEKEMIIRIKERLGGVGSIQ